MRKLHTAILASAILLAGCGPTSKSAPSEPTAEPTPEIKTYAVGESVKAGDFEFTLRSVEERAKASDNPFADPAGPGELFVVAKLAVKNLGSKPADTSEIPQVQLQDPEGTAYSEDMMNSSLASTDEGLDVQSEINPGVTYRSAVAWKVAKGAFDPTTWKIVVSADPAFEYRLK